MLIGPEQEQVTASCGRGDKHPCSIKCAKFFDNMIASLQEFCYVELVSLLVGWLVY